MIHYDEIAGRMSSHVTRHLMIREESERFVLFSMNEVKMFVV